MSVIHHGRGTVTGNPVTAPRQPSIDTKLVSPSAMQTLSRTLEWR
ncbi:MAG TPA: hypothetical protein VIL01_07550 [Thermomicrobiales bacterium]